MLKLAMPREVRAIVAKKQCVGFAMDGGTGFVLVIPSFPSAQANL